MYIASYAVLWQTNNTAAGATMKASYLESSINCLMQELVGYKIYVNVGVKIIISTHSLDFILTPCYWNLL